MTDGSFGGQMAELDFEGTEKLKTPDQLPDRIDFSTIPENVLRSSVIDSLMSQNDDLMSRLTVSLRRIALLEEKVTDARTENAQTKAQYDNLKDQVLVLKEQSRLLVERAHKAEEKTKREDASVNELKEKIQLLEIRYAELYSSSQEAQSKLSYKLTESEHMLARYRKYRKNMRRALIFVREELKQLRVKRSVQDSAIEDFKRNLEETTHYITEQAKEHKNQIANLTTAYETELRNHKGEIEMLYTQNRTLGERSQNLDRVYNEKIKLENDLIIAERKGEEMQIQTAAEISDLQKSLARYRNEAGELALELESKSQELADKAELSARITQEKRALSEQVEALQLLWRDQQNQLEKTMEQKNSLQKLNQEFSMAINEYRREVRELKSQNEELSARLSEKEKPIAAAPVPTTEVKREDVITPEIMAKIDQAISTIHSGH